MNTRQTLSILLIEDNPGDSNLIRLYLKEASVKHELFIAESFFDGVETAKQQDIELILLDLSLPDSTGFKTLSNFMEKVPNIPIIVLTGTNNEIVGNQAIKAGAQDFLVKGQFDGKLLGRSIRYSLQRYKTHLKLEAIASELAINEKRYVEAQEMAHFGNWEVDLVSNEMRWTDEVYRIFGFQAGSFQPTLSGYINYVHLEDKEKVEQFFEQAAKDGQLHQTEHRIVVEGKNIKYLTIQAKAYYEEINNKLLLVGVLQDITERKLGEQLIIEKNISSRASKIKEEALADMSFHIRTPLSSIINLLFLLEKSSVTSQQVEYMDGLKTSVDDLSIMINNLLNFSVLVSEQLNVEEEEFTAKDFFQSMQKVVKIKADNANIALNTQFDQQLPEKIIADTNKLTQVLYNLVDFVIKRSQDSDQLRFGIQMKSEAQQEYLSIELANDQLQLEAEAIKELSQSDKLLEVYSGQSEEISKPQMGMAIVIKLVETLGGTLDIKSPADAGTSFQVKLPVRVPRKVQLSVQDKPEMPVRILLVEDHFLNQIATKKVLTTWSEFVTVDIAENGLIGVEKYREHGYDIILMDIQMPVMTGLEASSKIREKSNVPIIALTAHSSKQEADRCFEIGINDYLAKPFKPHELYAKIMNLLVTVGGAV